eukprot:1157291-Pelagomonas_calceolata.AAC.4
MLDSLPSPRQPPSHRGEAGKSTRLSQLTQSLAVTRPRSQIKQDQTAHPHDKFQASKIKVCIQTTGFKLACTGRQVRLRGLANALGTVHGAHPPHAGGPLSAMEKELPGLRHLDPIHQGKRDKKIVNREWCVCIGTFCIAQGFSSAEEDSVLLTKPDSNRYDTLTVNLS